MAFRELNSKKEHQLDLFQQEKLFWLPRGEWTNNNNVKCSFIVGVCACARLINIHSRTRIPFFMWVVRFLCESCCKFNSGIHWYGMLKKKHTTTICLYPIHAHHTGDVHVDWLLFDFFLNYSLLFPPIWISKHCAYLALVSKSKPIACLFDNRKIDKYEIWKWSKLIKSKSQMSKTNEKKYYTNIVYVVSSDWFLWYLRAQLCFIHR